jgi:hypothetical protein
LFTLIQLSLAEDEDLGLVVSAGDKSATEGNAGVEEEEEEEAGEEVVLEAERSR